MMQKYKEMYLQLFNAITDAIEALEKANYGSAREILILAQQRAEEAFLNSET